MKEYALRTKRLQNTLISYHCFLFFQDLNCRNGFINIQLLRSSGAAVGHKMEWFLGMIKGENLLLLVYFGDPCRI